MHLPHISSRHNAIVTRYRTLARHAGDAELLLDGAHLVVDALSAGVALKHAVVSSEDDSPEMRQLVERLAARGVDIATASRAVMDAISPVKSASAIVGIAERPRHVIDDVIQPDHVAVIACDVQDPGNLGAIIRVAEAAGAIGVVAAGTSADPFGWKALRGSMGSGLRLPVAVIAERDDALTAARRRGCRTVACVPRHGEPLFEADLRGGLALLIGAEGAGLPLDVAAAANLCVTIPMEKPVDSLNAAVAAALVLYEARRQRTAAP